MCEFYPEGILLNTPANRRRTESAAALAEAAIAEEVVEARAVLCDNEHNL